MQRVVCFKKTLVCFDSGVLVNIPCLCFFTNLVVVQKLCGLCFYFLIGVFSCPTILRRNNKIQARITSYYRRLFFNSDKINVFSLVWIFFA